MLKIDQDVSVIAISSVYSFLGKCVQAQSIEIGLFDKHVDIIMAIEIAPCDSDTATASCKLCT